MPCSPRVYVFEMPSSSIIEHHSRNRRGLRIVCAVNQENVVGRRNALLDFNHPSVLVSDDHWFFLWSAFAGDIHKTLIAFVLDSR